MTLSEESQLFIGNLRAYLNVSGKKEEEIEEIVTEIEDHLMQAEAEGKDIQDIIGKSPKAYMESIESEMETDTNPFKIFLIIIFGGLAIGIMPEIMTGELSYSLFKIAGLLIDFTLITVSLIVLIKLLSKANVQTKKAVFIMTPLFILSIAFLVGVFLLDDKINSPVITLTGLPVYVIGFVLALFLIGLSIWSKSWIILIVVFVISLPELFGRFLNLSTESTAILFLVIISIFNVSLIIYFIREYKKDKAS